MRPERPALIGLRYARRGLAWALRSQRNMRIECAVGALALLLAVWLRAPLAPVLLACGLVLTAEVFNSAIEQVVDLLRPDHHPIAGRAKDAAAGAVLVAAAVSVTVGLVVLGPPLLARLGSLVD